MDWFHSSCLLVYFRPTRDQVETRKMSGQGGIHRDAAGLEVVEALVGLTGGPRGMPGIVRWFCFLLCGSTPTSLLSGSPGR